MVTADWMQGSRVKRVPDRDAPRDIPATSSGVEGAFGQPQKFPVRETNIPSFIYLREPLRRLESVANDSGLSTSGDIL